MLKKIGIEKPCAASNCTLKYLLAVMTVLFSYELCLAQASTQNISPDILLILHNMSLKYQQADHLSFDIKYTYANESKPQVHLDSLKGSYKINGKDYWYSLDNTEAMGNSDVSLILFKEDKIIYLSRPSPRLQSFSALALLDSFLLNHKDINANLNHLQNVEEIRLDFQEGSKYKSLAYDIDKQTGFLTRMVTVVQGGQLYDPSIRSQLEKNSIYVIVETLFTNYRERSFSNDEFKSGKYFKKEGSQYVSMEPFQTYKIFLGTPNL